MDTIDINIDEQANTSSTVLKMKIIGVGGAGANAVGKMDISGIEGIQLATINTDAQALKNSRIPEKLLIGSSVTRGLGAGGEVEIGLAAAESDRAAIGAMLLDQDLIVLVVGLGGGTGSAVAPLIAEMASKSDSLVLAFVTIPFSFEGVRRKTIAEESIGALRKRVHGLMSLPNDVLLQEGEEDTSVLNAFAVTDQWICRGVQSLGAMLFKTGLINQDFGSLKSVFQGKGGRTIFGIGSATGDNYVQHALDDLFLCPLLHLGDRPAQLDRILVNVVGGRDLGIAKVNGLMTEVARRFGSREDLVFGAVIDDNLERSLEICVLGKSEMERLESFPTAHSENVSRNIVERMESLGLETEIMRGDRSSHTVHKSKLSRKAASPVDQEEFLFTDIEAQRGYFDKTVQNLYKGEDLDVPTYLRKGIKIKIKT